MKATEAVEILLQTLILKATKNNYNGWWLTSVG
jgi:hypothetical protein